VLLDGRYELGTALGCGSTGTVWEARDHLTSRIVAVKVIHPELLGAASARRRFLREVASAESLRHPHTVQVLTHGQTPEGTGYLVMERLAGVTLSALLSATGWLEQRRAIAIAAQILEAAGAAHRLLIVHRDLKPSNIILVAHEGDPEFVKVCDFGLAKAIEVDDPASGEEEERTAAPYGSSMTELGTICGTPAYMAPEQARGEELDGRADLYAVGVLLFEALVGRVPFSGRSTLAVVSQHLSAAPPRPSSLRPDLRIFPPLESLILRALAKNRAERPSSAEVFRADLLQIDRDLVREARRAPRPRPRSSSADAATLPRGRKMVSAKRSTFGRLAISGAIALGAAVVWRLSVPSLKPLREVTATVGNGTRPDLTWPPAPDQRRPLPVSPAEVAVSGAANARAPASAAPSARKMESGDGGEARPARARGRSSTPATRTIEAARGPSRTGFPAARTAGDGAASETGGGRRLAEGKRLVARAEVLLGMGRLVEACALGRAAAEVAPTDASVWELLGRCHMRLGQPADARAAYRRYLALAPDGPDAVFVRAIVDRELK